MQYSEVFEKLGGVEAMTAWARAHPSHFYREIYARLLPTRTEVDARIDTARSVKDMTDAELLAAIQQNPAFVSLTTLASAARNAATVSDLHGPGADPDQEPYGLRK